MGLSDLEHFSLEVDEKLLRFMDQLELLEEKRASLNALIEQGWFSISKARYAMGNKQVSSLQYASDIAPRLCVNTRPLENCEIKFSTIEAQGQSDDLKSVENIGPQDTGVRRRNTKKHDEKGEIQRAIPEQPQEILKARACSPNPQQDPIKWFGILVPQSLKQAQTSFKQVIELSTEIASLQTAILNTMQELSETKAKIQVTVSTSELINLKDH